MKIAFFDTRSYDKKSFAKENEAFGYEIDFRDYKLNENTALTEETKHIVNHDTMKMMKSDAVIINTGRGASGIPYNQRAQKSCRYDTGKHQGF